MLLYDSFANQTESKIFLMPNEVLSITFLSGFHLLCQRRSPISLFEPFHSICSLLLKFSIIIYGYLSCLCAWKELWLFHSCCVEEIREGVKEILHIFLVVLTGPTYQSLLKRLAQVRFLTLSCWEICQDDWKLASDLYRGNMRLLQLFLLDLTIITDVVSLKPALLCTKEVF